MASGVENAGGERGPAPVSLRGLDLVNLFAADVRDGLGPYLAEFLKSRHWAPGLIGAAVATSNLASVACQIPAGLVVDASHSKRLLVVASALTVLAGALLIAVVAAPPAVFVGQAALGAAASLITPTIAALSLGIVGRRRMAARVSRNESFNHGGNFLGAILAGTLGQLLGYVWVFYLAAGFAAGTALVSRLIRKQDIDDVQARGGEDATGGSKPLSFSAVLKRRDLRIFLACVMLFHLANGAMLPLAGQVLAARHPKVAVVSLSACIIVAQATMVWVAWLVGRALRSGIGRKPVFAVVFAILPVRAVLFSLTTNPVAIVALQTLDGMAAGVFGVVSVVIASDIMAGTGRFNLAQSLSMLSLDVAAGLSNVIAGQIAQAAGYPTAFRTLAGVAICGLCVFLWLMPETSPDKTSKQT